MCVYVCVELNAGSRSRQRKYKKSVAYIAAHSQCGGRGVYAINHERIQFRQNVKAPCIVKSISVCVCLCVGDSVRAAVCVCVLCLCAAWLGCEPWQSGGKDLHNTVAIA